MADPQIGQGFNSDIAYRYKPGQTAAEFYSQKTGQTFGSPDQLASYVNQNYQGANADAQNVFGVLAGGYTPRAQALDQIKTDLNNYQQQTFNSGQPESAKRASSSLTDSINSQQSDLDKYLQEYSDLKTKLQNIPAPNFQDAYNTLGQQQGIPGFQQDYANLSQQRRELPYIQRANTGNAGVATEGQLAAQTNENDVPLYIQQSNALDRLKLAQDFVNNSLNLKELDYNTSRQALLDAATLTGQTIDFSRNSLNDLVERQQYEQQLQEKAQQFAIDNAIDQPYYQIGNKIYDTASRTLKFVNNNGTILSADGSKAYSTPEQFFKDSGISSFDQIYHLNSTTVADKNAVLDLRQKYPDAGISATDSFAVASSKLGNSRIYQDQVRGPVGSGGSSGAGDLVAAYYASQVASGAIPITAVPAAMRNAVATQLANSGTNIINPQQAGKSQDAISAFNSADAMLNTIQDLTNKVVKAGNAGTAWLQGISGAIGSKLKTDPNAVLFKSTIDAFTSQLSRAAGEKGVLTDQDVARIKAALPSLNDTKDIAAAKLGTLRSLFESKKQGAVSAYTNPINGGQNNDPLGIR